MSFIVAWITSILGIVALGTVVDLLLAKSRLKNFIRAIFATVSILVIITPLPAIIDKGFNLSWSDISGQIDIDSDFIDYSSDLKVKALESALESAFAQEGIDNIKIDVVADVAGNDMEVKCVTVDLSNSVIKENISNINKYEFIKERVRTFIGKQEVEIVINE